jgi:hypothetical protein
MCVQNRKQSQSPEGHFHGLSADLSPGFCVSAIEKIFIDPERVRQQVNSANAVIKSPAKARAKSRASPATGKHVGHCLRSFRFFDKAEELLLTPETKTSPGKNKKSPFISAP